jgi:hypothetical protein
MLGCLFLFELLRAELRALKPEALLYTEPSGILYRRTMDLTYNYDEQWLVRAVMTGGAGRSHWIRNGRELGRWFHDRDASLPRGSLTAHHLDSHDSFWWPHPGQKWRREQFGLPATAALMTMFALSGGPMMTFVGGELGIEDEVRAVNRLRAASAAFGRGVSDYAAIEVDDDDVYAVLRHLDGATGLLLVNLSDHEVVTHCSLVAGVIAAAAHRLLTSDALGGGPIAWSRRDGRWIADITLRPWQSVASQVRA